MKSALTIAFAVAAVTCASFAQAQGSMRIFRCGNTYTNDADQARQQGCKLVEGGNVTVVEGTKVNGANAVKVAANTQRDTAAAPAGQKVSADDQKARDSDARAILEAELKKAEARKAELAKDWNNGEPEKLGPEHRNHQKYLDRVAEIKDAIARVDNDIAGLKRELARTGGAASAAK
jgi:hypothetical protein